ncbi:MAG: hypothetical protein KF823_01300 [Xanthomonadales bacterium]|nr:hypothetical protein [Xanthomonadales bacterium]
MKSMRSRPLLAAAVILAGVASIVGTSRPPGTRAETTGEILGVSLSPPVLCLDRPGPPLAEVSVSLRSSNNQCIDIKINGEPLVSPFGSTFEPSIAGQNRCGTGDWQESYRFSLANRFGTTLPAEVIAEATLFSGGLSVTAQQRQFDQRTARMETRLSCPPSQLLPGG